MSDTSSTGFGQFVPGFDFLQNLAKSTSQAIPQMPNMANWIAPTLSVEELDKRISELKAVHFWLDQNSKALAATVQALEVQKMTLATLKGMNFNMTDVANAFKLKAADTVASGLQKVSHTAAATVQTVSDVAGKTEDMAKKVGEAAKPAAAAAVAGLVDPMQLWNSLTHQFQAIAASAMAEVGKASAKDVGKNLVKGAAKGVAKQVSKASAVSPPAKKAAAKRVAAKAPAKAAAKKTAEASARGARRR
ncbi:PhaM family polyhydroxyalkanoate granule multifunctional regulatory protein [Rhodoferax sp. BLA1]|uniref:PhaM family polyhydroxyalkanoate granule multifunctional regulatory protein n=1 Tax=Rhodoferax sp. BLA1 TaxID=2576062 RepID=UPI0015D391CE|nr:PhaM family polyhydroxyalkanoate granule multifunctional regulatory protein [Rhodoferax sp. BLA1]